jgi:hypothetical protein
MDLSLVELRQYTLRPGRRDDLVELFDRELVETQEACGMRVLGQFRDLARPDRFVWLRAFADAGARQAALTAFYGGPVWAEHGPAANDTMLAWDDVLLLRPVVPLRLPESRPYDAAPPARLTISVHPRAAEPALDRGDLLGLLVTDPTPNTFTRLPVREGEDVAVRIGRDDPPVAAGQLVRAEATARSWLR